jgi:hypothetical protein
LSSMSESPNTAFRSGVDGGSSVFGMASFIAAPSGCVVMTLVVECGAVLSSRNPRCVEISDTLRRLASLHGANRTHHALPLQVLF